MAAKKNEPPVGLLFEIVNTDTPKIYAVTADLARAVIAVAEDGIVNSDGPVQGYVIYWLDTDGGRHHYNVAVGKKNIILVLSRAARHAILKGGWAARIYANRIARPLTAALCPWEPFAKGTNKPHVVPLGAGTHLVSVDAIAALWRVSLETVRKWLDSIGCPTVQSPAKGIYVNLVILEASLLRKDTGCTWEQAFNLLSTARNLYETYREQGWIDRLAKMGSVLMPKTCILKSSKPPVQVTSPSPAAASPQAPDASSSTPSAESGKTPSSTP